MTHSGEAVEIEALVREAFSRLAVAAHARGIELVVHIDLRLPARGRGDGAELAAYLRRGLARTIEAGRCSRIALALWRAPGDAGIELEVGRALDEAAPPPAGLAVLWALPIGGQRVEPRPRRREPHAETVVVALPLAPERDAPPRAGRRRARFKGRHVLLVSDMLIDTGRLGESVAALGAELDVRPAPEAALALARRRVEAGKAVDMVLVDAAALGPAAAELARAFRADRRLSEALIVLAGAGRCELLPADATGLFDAAPRGPMSWFRLLDAFQELLEARRRRDSRDPAPGRPNGAAIPRLAGRRILIAEDVDTNQLLLRAILAPTGASIETVASGDAVLARQAAAPADLIVMDLQMPGMGGIAAARRVRGLAGKAGEVPIVALTAYAQGADRDRALGAGMNAYLSKPVVVAEFYDLVRHLLGAGAR